MSSGCFTGARFARHRLTYAPFRDCRRGAALQARCSQEKLQQARQQKRLLRLVPEQPLMHLVAVAAAAVFCTCPPALAEIQTVAPQDATSFARTLPKQRVNKGKVWLLFLAGATTLFGAALALEKSSALFPAIAKANQAIAATREAQKKKKEEAAVIDLEKVSEPQSEAAVLQGLADARTRAETGASESGQTNSLPEEEQQQQQHGGSPNGSHTGNKPAAAQHSDIQEATSPDHSSIDDAEKEGIVSR